MSDGSSRFVGTEERMMRTMLIEGRGSRRIDEEGVALMPRIGADCRHGAQLELTNKRLYYDMRGTPWIEPI
jgi:hypothetical protein